mmetsp:Transcript_28141/g.45601  ORF Transcript_28141/g.45601 Transcript_28141/m.45601 type:complete len:212 (-) Transcript_28141:2128-2763(-)
MQYSLKRSARFLRGRPSPMPGTSTIFSGIGVRPLPTISLPPILSTTTLLPSPKNCCWQARTNSRSSLSCSPKCAFAPGFRLDLGGSLKSLLASSSSSHSRKYLVSSSSESSPSSPSKSFSYASFASSNPSSSSSSFLSNGGSRLLGTKPPCPCPCPALPPRGDDGNDDLDVGDDGCSSPPPPPPRFGRTPPAPILRPPTPEGPWPDMALAM